MLRAARVVVTAPAVPLALAALLVTIVGASGCGRANPRVSSVVRTEGDRVVTTNVSYDAAGHPSTVERLVGDEEEPRDVATLTWADGRLTQIVRIESFDGFSHVTTTDLAYERDLPVGATAKTVRVRDDAEEGEEPDDVSDETFVVTYDGALVETIERSFEDDDRNRARTLLTFGYDVGGLVSVREETEEDNNDGSDDVEIARTTTVEYDDEDRPAKVSVADDDERPLVMDVVYKRDVLEELALAIPALDEANNEFIAEGRVAYTFDSDERLDGVVFESDVAETVELEIEYDDAEGDATGIDTMPAGAVQLPLWDLRGHAYDVIDARTQVARFLGASW